MVGEHFLDLGDCPGRVEVLGAGLGAVHDRVALEHRVRVVHLLQTLRLRNKIKNTFIFNEPNRGV